MTFSIVPLTPTQVKTLRMVWDDYYVSHRAKVRNQLYSLGLTTCYFGGPVKADITMLGARSLFHSLSRKRPPPGNVMVLTRTAKNG